MKDLITKSQKHLLWKDELGDDFLLTNFAEIYRFGKNTLRLHFFSFQKWLLLQKTGVIFNVWKTDDSLYIADAQIANLPRILALGTHRRRPHHNGKWIKHKEILLGHKILLYRPKWKDKSENKA